MSLRIICPEEHVADLDVSGAVRPAAAKGAPVDA
jgi:hypothetical protein